MGTIKSRNILNYAMENAGILVHKKSSFPKDFPKTQGVYLIRDKSEKIIYVGKAKNLHRRINSDHISGDLDMTTSIFRKKLSRKFPKIVPGKQMRKWVIENCLFSFVEIENPDLCHLVEALTIIIARDSNLGLMNA